MIEVGDTITIKAVWQHLNPSWRWWTPWRKKWLRDEQPTIRQFVVTKKF